MKIKRLSLIAAALLYAMPYTLSAQAIAAPATSATSATSAAQAVPSVAAVPSIVSEATVFFNGAELTHTAKARLMRGENEITIEGLSPRIDVNSLKIRVSDDVVIASSEFTVDYMNSAREVTPLIEDLQKKIETKREELEKTDVDIRVNDNMLSLLNEGIEKNVSGSEHGLGTDELKKTLDYYALKSGELEGNRTALNNRRVKLQVELRALQNQYDQEFTVGTKTSGVLRLNLVSPRELTASFAIIYYTPNAGWEPCYDINITDTDKPVNIIAKSKVRQTTGLDWEKVRLTLSTSVPNNGKTAPLFSAWYLSPIEYTINVLADMINVVENTEVIQNSYSYEEAAVADMASKVVASHSPVMVSPTMQNYIATSENQLNVTYAIELPYTIPGNGKEQNIDLMSKSAEAAYKYYTTPKLDMRTYLIAEIGDWQNLGLLSGKANITYAGTYVGETYIDTSSTAEKLTLTLGTDARIAVKRETLHEFTSTRTIGGDIQRVFTYRVTVKNNQTQPVKLTTKEQYPISTQKNIEVTLRTKETTPGSANVEELGVITWEEELAAGETRTYDISYSVRYPKNLQINL